MTVPYVYFMFKGDTRPQRMSWLIWLSVQACLLLGLNGDVANGLYWTVQAQVISIGVVFMFALTKGMYGWRLLDFVLLGISILGMTGWFLLPNENMAVASIIIADVCATTLTLLKAYELPETESRLMFALSALACLFSLLAAESLKFVDIAYPIYGVLACSAIIIVTSYRRKVMRSISPKKQMIY